MKSLKISVITISYNSGKTIERTIKSVLEQSYNNIEYIIVDGLSQDQTLSVIEPYKDKISKVISEKDRGISHAFNKGIELATGEIVGFINADDWLANSTTIEEIVDFYVKKSAPDIIYGDQIKLKGSKEWYVRPKSSAKIREGMVFFHPSTFVKKQVYQDIGGFSENYKIAMDYDFLLRALLAQKTFAYIPKLLTYFSDGGVSTANMKHQVKGLWECYKIQRQQGLSFLNSIYVFLKKVIGLFLREWFLVRLFPRGLHSYKRDLS